MYQILPLCKKHGSYTCRATLRNFVGNIPILLNFVRKIPTHGTKCKISSCSVGIIPILVGIIPTLQEDILHFVPCVGIFLTKFNRIGIFPTKFCKNSH